MTKNHNSASTVTEDCVAAETRATIRFPYFERLVGKCKKLGTSCDKIQTKIGCDGTRPSHMDGECEPKSARH